MGATDPAYLVVEPGGWIAIVRGYPSEEELQPDGRLRTQLSDAVLQFQGYPAVEPVDTERVDRRDQDGFDEEHGVQEDAAERAVGLPELSAGAEDAAVCVQSGI